MPEPDRDKSVERWLRQMPPAGTRAESPACLGAETLARWAEGLLNAPERASAETHASGCARCQAMLAVMVRTMPAPPPASASPMRKWLMMLSPALAAGAAVALWFAVDQRPPPATVESVARDERSASQAQEGPRSSATSPTVVLDKPTGSLDQAEPKRESAKKDQEAPKALADAFKAREERAGADKQAANTALARNRTLGERQSGAVPPNAAPAPPPSSPLGAAAESVQVAGARSAQTREAPNAAPMPQASQNQSQNQGPSPNQNQSQNQNSPRAAPAVADRRVDTVTSAGAGRGAQRSEPVSGFAAETVLGLRTNAATFDVVSPDASARWRIVDGRNVQRSLDAGATWTNHYSAEEGTVLTAGAAPTPTVCWLVGRAGAIVLTTDGRAWQRVKFPEPVDLTGVISTDARTATVTTGNGRGFRTTDGGRNWMPR